MIHKTLAVLALSIPMTLLGCAGSKDGGSGGGDTAIAGDTAGTAGAAGDADGDGYTDAALGGDDCDDSDPAIHPGADELCDGLDNDCNLAIDDGAVDAPSWYVDSDSDGYGDASSNSFQSCESTPGLVSQGGDCDDGDAAINPDATEICDGGIDNDCDGAADAEDPDVVLSAWYRDLDLDGYGDPADSVEDCVEPSGYVDNDGDCDDIDVDINPGAAEICDGLDNDCDPATSEEGTVTLDALDSYTSIQDALAAASAGSEILVCDGTYSEALIIPTSVTLRSANGSAFTTIDAGGAGAVIDIAPVASDGSVDLSVVGFTLTGGSGAAYDLDGDGVAAESIGGGVMALYTASLTLEDLVVEGNTADLGGGLVGSGYTAVYSTSDHFTDVVFRDNVATTSSAGAFYVFDAVLIGTELTGNTSLYGGAVIIDTGTLSADASTSFTDNQALYGGAIFTFSGATLDLDADTVISGNSATYDAALEVGGLGGGVYAQGLDNASSTPATTFLSGGQFLSNSADFGAGIYSLGSVEITDSVFDGNVASDSGAGLYLDALQVTLPTGTTDYVGESTLTGVSVTGGTAAVDGAGLLSVLQTVTVSDTEISGNVADGDGGGIWAYLSTVSVLGGSVVNNTAIDGGGAALYGGTMSATSSDWGDAKTDNTLDDVALTNDASIAGDTGDTGASGSSWTHFEDFGAGVSFDCDADTLSCE